MQKQCTETVHGEMRSALEVPTHDRGGERGVPTMGAFPGMSNRSFFLKASSKRIDAISAR